MTVVAAQAPEITLNGSNPVRLEEGTAFFDPGARANDNVDGNLTANIIVSGSVNTTQRFLYFDI
ncbi:MAG: DUF5011 domain-containing protein [Candidatus Methanofishera endochildressiae]|uniref:DUF5011 domain-containing protein n=1 Tax=Candidatus Methanofishera endochildressiae TaxID=2738884 RepID=A0A7Z0SDU7_9GAMM|nr:DUF5011 domain-containing protein [Candidatus Methanofishera endochildressiae]